MMYDGALQWHNHNWICEAEYVYKDYAHDAFEGLRINSRLIHDKMPGKPGWYKTWDMVPFFVGNHVNSVIFEP